MDTMDILLKFGQIAGIGGLSLGVLLLLFRDVIGKNIFPRLGQSQAYRLIKLIIVLTFSISALGIGAWVIVEISGARHAPRPNNSDISTLTPPLNPAKTEPEKTAPIQPGDSEPVIRRHLELTDAEKYGDAYQELSTDGKGRIPRDAFINVFEGYRKPLGKAISRVPYNATPLRQLEDGTEGTFLVNTYITDFEHGGKHLERMTLTAEQGKWKVLFHQVVRCQPALCPGQ